MRKFLGIIALLAFCSSAQAAITHVGSGTGGTSTSYTATVGNKLVVFVIWHAITGTPTISDTHNTYTRCTPTGVTFPFRGGSNSIDCFTAQLATGGALTIAVSGTSGDEATSVDEFSGMPSTSTFNGGATQDNSSSTQTTVQTTGTYTAGSSGDLAIAAFGSDNTTTGTTTVGSGFNLGNNVNSVGTLGKVVSEYQTTAANTTASFTNSVLGNWTGAVVSIKGSAATGCVNRRLQMGVGC